MKIKASKYYLAFVPFVLFTACRQEPANKQEKVSGEEIELIEKIVPLEAAEGLALLKNQCYTCHDPKAKSHDELLAPPLAGIKYRYQTLYPERANFIAHMSDFIQHPSKENAAMKGPVRRFGLMPVSPLPMEEIRKIVAFIYDNKMEAPDWFAEHFEAQHGTSWED